MANTTRRICFICGKRGIENEMVEVFTGRKKYACWECWKLGSREVTAHECKKKVKGAKDE